MPEDFITNEEQQNEVQESGLGETLAPAADESEQYPDLSELLNETEVPGENPVTDSGDTDQEQTEQQPTPKKGRNSLNERFASVESKGYQRGLDEAARKYEERIATLEGLVNSQQAMYAKYQIEDRAVQLAKDKGYTPDAAKAIAQLEYDLAMQKGEAFNVQPAEDASKPRDAQGRFVKPEPQSKPDDNSDLREYAKTLKQQAATIKAESGFDIEALFNSNKEFADAVARRETDFMSAYRAMVAMGKIGSNDARRTPPVAKSGNTNGYGTPPDASGGMSIANMTDDQFARLNDQLSRGAKYRAR